MNRAQVALPLIAVLAMVLFFSFGQSGQESVEAAGDVGMSLKFTGPDKSKEITRVAVGSKFAIQVVTDPAPIPVGENVGGFHFGVVIPAGGGIKYNGPVDFDTTNLLDCRVEINPPILENSTLTTCATHHTATKHSISVLAAGALNDGGGVLDGRVGVELADFAYRCNTVGTYEVTVIAHDPLTFATSFYTDTASFPFASKTVLDQNGDPVTASAKITCAPPGTIGGIAELQEVAGTPLEAPDSSGSNTGLLASVAGGVAATALALGGAAWYARRRWAR